MERYKDEVKNHKLVKFKAPHIPFATWSYC